MRALSLRDIAIMITFVLGFFIIFEYFVKWPEVNTMASNITQACTVIAGLATIVGVGNLTRIHIRNLTRRGPNYLHSIVLLCAIWIPLVIGIMYTRKTPSYVYLYNNVYGPISNAFFAVLAFYILSGAYRAFRARTFDSFILMLAAILVFLGNAPVTGNLWAGFDPLGSWILNVPNTAGYRGVIIGTAIGQTVLAVRVLLGRELGYLAQKRE